jgi:group I intron endonuclease
MGYIYILTSPSGKSYIGQTIRPIKKRLEEHETGRSKGCRVIYNAIKCHGWETFEKDWYECPDEDLNKHEELMIEVLGTLVPHGYNLKEGGSNGKHNEETKQKNREAQLGENNNMWGKTTSEETKQKQREAALGEKNHMFGKTHSEESIQKNRDAHLGEKNHKSKRVYQYALDGTFINSFESSGEASRYLKKNGTNIRECARGIRKTAHKFKWSYIKF